MHSRDSYLVDILDGESEGALSESYYAVVVAPKQIAVRKVDRDLLVWQRFRWRMLCSKNAVVRSQDVDDDLRISAPLSAVVEDEDGCKLDLGKVVALCW